MRRAVRKTLAVIIAALVLFVWVRPHIMLAEADYDFIDVEPFRVTLPYGEKAGLLTVANGKWIIPPQFDDIGTFSRESGDCYVPSALWIKTGNKYGLADKQGKIILPVGYDDITYADDGVYRVRTGGKWGLAAENGKLLLAPQYDAVESFREGLAVVGADKKYGYVDTAGNPVVPLQFDGAWNFSEGLAMVRVGDKRGYIDKSGKMTIEPKYDGEESTSFSEGLAAVRLNRKWGYIDKNGKTVIGFRYSEAKPFYKGVAVVSAHKTGLIDKTGKAMLEMKYDEISHDDGGLPMVTIYTGPGGSDCKCAFADTDGRFVTPFFDAAWEFSHGLAKVEVHGKYGFIDKTGEMVIKPIYNDAEKSFRDGYINVELDGKPGIIDAAGRWAADRNGTYYPAHKIMLERGPEGYFRDNRGNKLDHYANHIRDGYKFLRKGLKSNAAVAFRAALTINAGDQAALHGLDMAE